MNVLDRICLEAKTAARHADILAYRETAARDAERLPAIAHELHGEGKLRLSLAMRELMRALPHLSSHEARMKLAEALSFAADAARLEPDHPVLKNEEPYWLEKEAV